MTPTQVRAVPPPRVEAPSGGSPILLPPQHLDWPLSPTGHKGWPSTQSFPPGVQQEDHPPPQPVSHGGQGGRSLALLKGAPWGAWGQTRGGRSGTTWSRGEGDLKTLADSSFLWNQPQTTRLLPASVPGALTGTLSGDTSGSNERSFKKKNNNPFLHVEQSFCLW